MSGSQMAVPEYARMRDNEERHWWFRTLRTQVVRALARHVVRRSGLRLLDAGCGTGGGLRRWNVALGLDRSYGLDLSAAALQFSAGRGLGPLVRGSVTTLPFGDATFDAAVSLDVLCLEGVDEAAGLAELRRVLRPGGILVLNLPAFPGLRGEHDLAVRIRRRYRRPELEQLVTAAGFRVRRCGYWNALLFLPFALVRRIRSGRVADRPPVSDIRPLPGPLDALLAGLMRLEVAVSERVRLPFGTSLLCVAEVPTPD